MNHKPISGASGAALALCLLAGSAAHAQARSKDSGLDPGIPAAWQTGNATEGGSSRYEPYESGGMTSSREHPRVEPNPGMPSSREHPRVEPNAGMPSSREHPRMDPNPGMVGGERAMSALGARPGWGGRDGFARPATRPFAWAPHRRD